MQRETTMERRMLADVHRSDVQKKRNICIWHSRSWSFVCFHLFPPTRRLSVFFFPILLIFTDEPGYR